MRNKKRDNPVTVVIMAVAVVAVVWFGYQNIMNSIAPPPPTPKESLQLKPVPALGGKETDRSPEAAATSPGAPTTASATAGGPVAPPTSAPAPAQTAGLDEATLAPEADPFAPLYPSEFASATRTPPAASAFSTRRLPDVRTWPHQTVPPSGAPPALVPTGDGAPMASGLPGLGPAPVRAIGSPTPMPLEAKEPELVGTMLGDRPSAVFRTEKALSVVAVGERFGLWRVIAVHHGGAVLRSSGREIRLVVGGKHATGSIQAATEEETETATPVDLPSEPVALATGQPRPVQEGEKPAGPEEEPMPPPAPPKPEEAK